MITNLKNEIRLYRKYKGGFWCKTKHRGWIPLYDYNLYIGYGFNPELIKTEEY